MEVIYYNKSNFPNHEICIDYKDSLLEGKVPTNEEISSFAIAYIYQEYMCPDVEVSIVYHERCAVVTIIPN